MNKFTAVAATVVIADIGWHVFQGLRVDQESRAKTNYIESWLSKLRVRRAAAWQRWASGSVSGVTTTTTSNGNTVKITYTTGGGGGGGSVYGYGAGGNGGSGGGSGV